jgi:uncharacterized membrane protein YkvI
MQMKAKISSVARRLLQVYWSIFYGAARVTALLMMVATVVGAVVLAADGESQMHAPMRWGLVVLLSFIAIICFMALRAPTKRQ